jgi:lysophospholipase L1-like esterase
MAPSRLKRTVFIAIAVLVILSPIFAAEAVVRGMGLGDPVVYATNAAYRYAPLPNQHIARRGATVTIGPEGLRGLDSWSGAADNRVLFVGDSVTWGGTNTDDDKTFAYLTCEKLKARFRQKFICGNAGVNGYGTDNMIARLQYDAQLKRADTIVVTLISVDPIRGTSDLASAHFFTRRPFGPMRGIWEVAAYGALTVATRLRLDPAAYDDRFDIPVAMEALQRLYAELHALEKSGKRVLIVFSPHKDEFYGDPDDLDAAVRADLARSGFSFLDLTEPMRGVVKRGVYYDNVHLNPVGHALYADWIANALSPLVIASKPSQTTVAQ